MFSARAISLVAFKASSSKSRGAHGGPLFCHQSAAGRPSGAVSVTSAGAISGLPTDAQGKTLIFTPNVQKALLAPGVTGAIDWACGSTTNATAVGRGLSTGLGTMPAKYVPAECR